MVLYHLKHLIPGKSPGSGWVAPHLSSGVSRRTRLPLSISFNKCIKESTVSVQWIEACITAIHQKGAKKGTKQVSLQNILKNCQRFHSRVHDNERTICRCTTIPKIVNIKNAKKLLKKIKKWPMSTQNMAKNNNKIFFKNTKIKIKCVGGGGEGRGNLLYLLCLISNTLPQLEQSSLHPSTVPHDRHLLQTTCYNHLLLLLHLLISRKEKKQAATG